MNIQKMSEAIEALQELQDDSTVPRNVKTKISAIITNLQANVDVRIKVSKALSNLDEISDDANILSYTRMQLMNISSLLEQI